MPEFLHSNNLADRERLVAFVAFVHGLLEEVVEKGPVASELKVEVQGAWREIEDAKLFELMEAAVREVSDSQLSAHGLSRLQLQYKRSSIGRWWDRWRANPIVSLLKRLFDVVDKLLDSLVDAVGVGKAIKEFKEHLGDSLDE